MDNVELDWQNHVLGGWLRLPNSTNAEISIRGPGHFSGTLPLRMRGTIVDFSMSGQAVNSTEPQIVNVNVYPVADNVKQPSVDYTVRVEDSDPIPFGATLVGVRVKDNGNTRRGNNPETETFSKVHLKLPADSASVIYSVTAGSYLPAGYAHGIYAGDETAQIKYDSDLREFEIYSTIIRDAADVGSLSLEDRKTASNHIMTTLAEFAVSIGPEHTDDNGSIDVVVTTLDVNLGAFSEKDNAFTHNIVVLAVADVSSSLVLLHTACLATFLSHMFAAFVFLQSRKQAFSRIQRLQLTKTLEASLSASMSHKVTTRTSLRFFLFELRFQKRITY